MENIFVEFLPPWVETGLQPAFYDKESGTVLQQTARMYDRVNMLIRMFNKLSRETKQSFEELYNYVHDYIENHFDETIEAKIDAMLEDGSLEALIRASLNQEMIFDNIKDMLAYDTYIEGNIVRTLGYSSINDGGASLYKIVKDDLTADDKTIYAVNDELFAVMIPENGKINVMQLGMTGKGNYDEDLTYLASYVHDNVISEVDFNKETYATTQYTVFNVSSEEFKMDFNGGTIRLDSSFRYFNYGIFTINMDKTKNTSCTIINGNFDGSGNPADFSNLNVNPKGGRGMFFINGARYIKADNLNFDYWFYSACIWSHYCKAGDFTNIIGTRVGGRSADNTEDARGDALYFGYCGVVEDGGGNVDVDASYPVNINISNCHFESWKAISTLYPGAADQEGRNGCQSGRAGVVLAEYSNTNAQKVFNINNCYFYNYQRNFHLESVKNISVNVKNSTIYNYGQLLLMHAGSDVYNNIVFDKCTIKKDVDVIAIYNDYKFIISGGLDNKCESIQFNDCNIEDDYDKLILLGDKINFIFKDSDIKIEYFFVYNTYPFFKNSSVKFNQSNFFKSGYEFDNCYIESGYKNDANSKSFLYAKDGNNITKNNIIKNSETFNLGLHGAKKKFVLENNTMSYDDNFNTVDYAGTTRNYFISTYGEKLEKFSNNVVKNGNSSVTNIADSSNIGDYIIDYNVFYNCQLKVINSTGYKSVISNNKFINTTNTITGAVSDLYGSKCIWHDNLYLGYTTAMSNYSSATQYNNYISSDGTSITLIGA